MKKTFVTIFFLLAALPVCSAVKIHVSPNGDDRNDGSREKPVATLEGARNRLRSLKSRSEINDSVIIEIASGIYYIEKPLELNHYDGGSASMPVVFRGDKKNRPVICGGKRTPRFEEVSPSLWRTFIPEMLGEQKFEQLYVNGERRCRARTPNRGSWMHIKRSENYTTDAERNSMSLCVKKIVVGNNDSDALKLINGDATDEALVVFHNRWDVQRERVNSISVSDSTIYVMGFLGPAWSKYYQQTRFYVENQRNALDERGEWFMASDGWLYYIPMEGETPETTECLYPVSDAFVNICGTEKQEVEGVKFENMRFLVSSYTAPPYENDGGQAAQFIPYAINVNHANNVAFVNCDIAHTGQHAIGMKENCSQSAVVHCHLYDIGGSGIQIGSLTKPSMKSDGDMSAPPTNNITIENNIIQHGGRVFASAPGIVFYNASDNRVAHNDIADFFYTGISVGYTWGYHLSPTKRNTIEFNHIHHLGWGELSDMGGIYTLGRSEGTIVRGNVVHHIYSFDYGGWGLYADEGSTGIVFEDNLVYRCKEAGFQLHYAKDIVVRNNIFALNLLDQLNLSKKESHHQMTFVGNVIYFKTKSLTSTKQKKGHWLKCNVTMDRNCYWNPETKGFLIDSLSLKEWQQAGRDKHTIVANPLFKNVDDNDFHFKSERIVKKIGFKPFDYSKAGVYGDEDWKQKALLPQKSLDDFEKLMSQDVEQQRRKLLEAVK